MEKPKPLSGTKFLEDSVMNGSFDDAARIYSLEASENHNNELLPKIEQPPMTNRSSNKKESNESPPSPHQSKRLSPLGEDNVIKLSKSLDQISTADGTSMLTSPYRNRLLQTTAGNRSRSNSSSLNASINIGRLKRNPTLPSCFIHMLPDPAVLINDKGHIGQLNVAFEKMFRHIVSASLSIYDFIELSLLDEFKEVFKEACESILPYMKQIHSTVILDTNIHEHRFAWTISSLGPRTEAINSLGSMDTYQYLIMYSRPKVETVLCDLNTANLQFMRRHKRRDSRVSSTDMGLETSEIDTGAAGGDNLSSPNRISWTFEGVGGSFSSRSSISIMHEPAIAISRMNTDTSLPNSHALLASEDTTNSGSERFNRRFIHEIRTPLHIILNNLQQMDLHVNEVQEIMRSALDLKGILDDYSFMSQIQSAPIDSLPPRSTTTFHLPSVMETIGSHLLTLYCRHIEYNCEHIDDTLHGDKVYLERILTHLFSNAAKYSPENSAIHIQAHGDLSSTQVHFSIANLCLPSFNVVDIVHSLNSSLSNYQSYINHKEEQNRLTSAGNLAYSHGLGFGLSVAANMVRCLGGRLSCSVDVNGTAVFFAFSIPLDRAAIPLEGDGIIGLLHDSTSPGPGFSMKKTPLSKILVVDDSAVCRKVLVSKLIERGFLADSSMNGLEACKLLEAQRGAYDAVLLDLHMPLMDGIEATRYIRQNLHSNIPILVISAEQGDSEQEAILAGADAFMGKPAIAKDVIERMMKLIGDKKKKSTGLPAVSTSRSYMETYRNL